MLFQLPKNIFLLILISDYYFVAWLMLAKTPYTIDSLASWSNPYHLSTMVEDVENRVKTIILNDADEKLCLAR